MPPAANLRSVAKIAGVSHVTVSRVLKNERWVKECTRERVLEAVRLAGYRPNPLVSAAMAQRRSPDRLACSTVIAYLNCYNDQELWRSSPSQSRFLNGARTRAEELGFSVEEFHLFDRGMNPRRIQRMLESRGIAGLIVGSFRSAHAHLSLDWDRFAAVAQAFTLTRPALHRAANHYFKSMEAALRALRRLGYRRIGLAISSEVDTRCQHAYSAAMAVYQRNIADADAIPVLNSGLKDAAILRRWHGRWRPQVIVTPHLCAIDTLAAIGLSVPGDIALAHTDWHPNYVQWAGVDHCVETAGRAATDLLVTQLFTNQRGLPAAAISMLTEGVWVDGPSAPRIDVPAPLPRLPRSVMVSD